LDGDPEPSAHPHRVLRHVYLAVVDHDRVGQDADGPEHHVFRDTGVGAGGCGPCASPTLRGHGLEQDVRDVSGPRREWPQPNSLDGTVEQVHRHGELGIDPAHRHRLHREDVQLVPVQEDVLPRARGAELTEHALRAFGHRAALLGVVEGVAPVVQFNEPLVGH